MTKEKELCKACRRPIAGESPMAINDQFAAYEFIVYNAIDAWHNNYDYDYPLSFYLGLTEEQYKAFVEARWAGVIKND